MIESVVVWKWAKPGYRSTFKAEHVNTMAKMVARHYQHPHRFICITDEGAGIDPGIEVVPIWTEWADIPNPTWPGIGPSCYRRLRAFSPEFEAIAGKRFVSIDLDCVVVDDLTPLWDRDEEFVIYSSFEGHYNGSMWMMTAGSRAKVWETFDPHTSPQTSNGARNYGSDQAWIAYVLGNGEARWSRDDGVYAYKRDCLGKRHGALPRDARLVIFHGKPDPWDNHAIRRSPWIRKHYR